LLQGLNGEIRIGGSLTTRHAPFQYPATTPARSPAMTLATAPAKTTAMAPASHSMTYDEIAVAFGINRSSAERLVKRKRWARRKGNDGRARIEVPEEAIPAGGEDRRDRDDDPGRDGGPDRGHDPGGDPGHGGGHDPLLKHLVARLEAENAELRPKAAERDVFAAMVAELRPKADELVAVKAMLEIERQRVEEWKAVADRWAQQMEQIIQALPAPAPVVERRGLFGWLRRAG
jgi:hypothetical protein